MEDKIISLALFSSSYCNRCHQAKPSIQQLVKQLNQCYMGVKIYYSEIDVVDEIDLAVELGVLKTPSLVLNNQLIFNSMPAIEVLKVELVAAIQQINRVNNDENR